MLALLFPRAEIPLFQHLLQLRAALQTKFFKNVVEMELHGRWRDAHARGGLAVGMSQADQRGNFLLAGREGLPLLPELVQRIIFGEAGGQEFLGKLFFWTAFALCQCGQGNLKTFTDLKITRAGIWTQAYPVEQSLPDRHTGKL